MNQGNRLHDILLNSWESVYFKVNQKGMDEMMAAFSAMGGELFVMDDGWFGNKYPRNGENSSLGDWEVCREKLPKGIEGLDRKFNEANYWLPLTRTEINKAPQLQQNPGYD